MKAMPAKWAIGHPIEVSFSERTSDARGAIQSTFITLPTSNGVMSTAADATSAVAQPEQQAALRVAPKAPMAHQEQKASGTVHGRRPRADSTDMCLPRSTRSLRARRSRLPSWHRARPRVPTPLHEGRNEGETGPGQEITGDEPAGRDSACPRLPPAGRRAPT
jgi:hypothetical protein